jgi:hypothetical protein
MDGVTCCRSPVLGNGQSWVDAPLFDRQIKGVCGSFKDGYLSGSLTIFAFFSTAHNVGRCLLRLRLIARHDDKAEVIGTSSTLYVMVATVRSIRMVFGVAKLVLLCALF